MPRIAGINIPADKRTDFALTAIYGIGRSNVYDVIESADVDPKKRVKELTKEEINRIQKILDSFKLEGELKREKAENIARLKAIGSYRGLRHSRNLPVRGQRTRSNARTKRGGRRTIGAMRKDMRAKFEQTSRKKKTNK